MTSSFSGNMLSTGIDSILNLPSADLAATIAQMEQQGEITGLFMPPVGNEEIVSENTNFIVPEQDTSPMLGSAPSGFMAQPMQVQQDNSMRKFLEMKQQMTELSEPRVVIVEEPRQRGLRFRYQCEGRSAGSIPGQSSTAEKKTYPTIKIVNHRGPAIVVVSCVTKDLPHKPHPHALVGKDCKKGVCTIKVKDTSVVSFPHLGIQCAKKKGIQDSLDLRKSVNVDPFQTGFEFVNNSAEMSVVRLCFQVFLPDGSGKITKVLPPVVSQPIHDKKALNDLIICRVDRSSGRVKGGDEVFILCEKINKDDIGIKFYEEKKDGSVEWEAFGEFGAGDVHRQYAIVFKTPAYKDPLIKKPVQVFMQLHRPSDLESSEPINFIYMPDDPDPDRIDEKRKRKAERMVNLVQDMSHPAIGGGARMGGANVHIKEGLRSKLKANRKVSQPNDIKTETVANSGVPTYSLSNIGDPAFLTNSSSVATYNYNNNSNSGFNVNIPFSSSNQVQPSLPITNPSYGTLQQQQLPQQQQQQPYFLQSDQADTMHFDPQRLDPQILLEYLQDKGIKADGQDILSFESLDMMNMVTGEYVTGLQNVGAHVQVNSSNVQDTNMDSDNKEMFMNVQDALRALEK